MKRIGIIALLIELTFCLYACGGEETTFITTEGLTSEPIPTTTETISEEPLVFEYANGIYDFSQANSELRETFLAAAETYLLDTMMGGIPLYANADYLVYHNRINLPVDQYISVLEYGAKFGSMNLDDSNVLMADGENGNPGEFTFRTSVNWYNSTYNQWFADTSGALEVMRLYLDSLYEFNINDSENGFLLAPSMASAEPIAINPTTDDDGNTLSYTWQIPIRDDLEWFFSPETDQTFINTLTPQERIIDANDFVDTYKLAIDEYWFRAVSGGGDFYTSSQRIKGLEAYLDGTGSWEDVGIKVVDGNIEFTFTYDQEAWSVMYWLHDIYLSPINLELYDYLEQDEDITTNYGNSYQTIAYSGPYYIENVSQTFDLIQMKSNPNFYDTNKYTYTGYEIHITDGSYESIKTLYDDGYLDFFEVEGADLEAYKETEHVVSINHGAVMRLNINATGTEEAFNELFPDSDFVPEPILANEVFRRAMFYVIDREALVEEKGFGVPSDRLFTDTYVMGVEGGVSYRNSDAGMQVGEDMSPDTYGYDIGKATNYFNQAIKELVESGIYEQGTPSNYTVISLELDCFNSESSIAVATFIKNAFETYFTSATYLIRVEVTVEPIEFPFSYFSYDHDMFIGGLSTSLLCPQSILNQYCSDNRSGFLMNYGYDTSIAEIEVVYTDSTGNKKAEIWSFDAIASALDGEVYVANGEEAVFPYVEISEITSTSITFNVINEETQRFDNLTYTILIYQIESDSYEELAGYIDVPVTSNQMTVTGLTPFYYWYTQNETIEYQSGDYKVQLNYDYVDYDQTGEYISQYFNTNTILPNSTTHGYTSEVATDTSIILDLSPDASYTGTIISLELTVYPIFTEYTAAMIDSTDIYAVSITGLVPDASYVLWVTYDDGLIDAIRFKTEPISTE